MGISSSSQLSGSEPCTALPSDNFPESLDSANPGGYLGPTGPAGRSAASTCVPVAPSDEAAVLPSSGQWKVLIAWVSVDPRSGEVSVYPRDVAERIEAAFLQGDRSVSLAGFGGFYNSATVELIGSSTGRPLQRTRTGGKRDIKRVQVPLGAKKVAIHIVKERGWSIADFPTPGVSEEREVPLVGYTLLPDESATSSKVIDAAAGPQARRAVALAGKKEGRVGLWEWCRLDIADDKDACKDLDRVPVDAWGIYTEAQNSEIETAFMAGRHSAKVSVGIREYEIIFDGVDRGKQVDHKMRKRRLVRRRLVSPDQQERISKQASEAMASKNQLKEDEEECSICFSKFAETPMMPVVRLPKCKHIFHCACAQHLADKNSQCPLCRSDVDWFQALKSSRAGA